MKHKKKPKPMSLTTQRQGELTLIADVFYSLSPSERDTYNSASDPDIVYYGCSGLPLTNDEDVPQLIADTTGLSHEEIEFLAIDLKNRAPLRGKLGIKPGANPGGSPSGTK